MFSFNENFNQPLDSWNVQNVKDMSNMFNWCISFVQPLTSWEISVDADTALMFQSSGYPMDLMPPRVLNNLSEEERYRYREAQELFEEKRRAMHPPNTVVFDVKENDECFDLIEGETTIKEALKEENSIFVFYTNDVNVSQRVSIPRSRIREATDNYEYIVYECKTADTMRDIDKNTMYFNIKKLTGFGDVVKATDMALVRTFWRKRIFLFKQTDKELVSTASHSVVFGRDPNYVGDRHCQSGQNARVYELMDNVVFTNMSVSSGGTKLKRKIVHKRKSAKRKGTKVYRRKSRRK